MTETTNEMTTKVEATLTALRRDLDAATGVTAWPMIVRVDGFYVVFDRSENVFRLETHVSEASGFDRAAADDVATIYEGKRVRIMTRREAIEIEIKTLEEVLQIIKDHA